MKFKSQQRQVKARFEGALIQDSKCNAFVGRNVSLKRRTNTHRELLQPYYSAWLPCFHYKCNKYKPERLLYESNIPREHRNLFWYVATAASSTLAMPLQKSAAGGSLDVGACSHRRAAPREILWVSAIAGGFTVLSYLISRKCFVNKNVPREYRCRGWGSTRSGNSPACAVSAPSASENIYLTRKL